METPTIKDIMTKEVISVRPDTPILDANEILAKHNFDGVPVIDAEGNLVGILTQYDMVVQGSFVHLPTFQKILSEVKFYKKGQDSISADIEELKKLKVNDIMNKEPLTLTDGALFADVVAAFRDHHRVNPIPVIDKNKKVVGVVSRYDVLKILSLIK